MSRYTLALAAALTLFGCDAITPFEPGDPEAVEEEGGTEPEPTTATLFFVNTDDFEVVRIWASPCEDSAWGAGVSVSLYTGDSYELAVDAPACYDLRADRETFDGTATTYYPGLNVEAGHSYTWSTP